MGVTVSYRLARLNKAVKDYSNDLYVVQTGGGTYQVWRRAYPIDVSGVTHTKRGMNEHFLFALTDDLKMTGNPIEMGIEPIMSILRSQDSWRDDGHYDRILAERKRLEEVEDREKTNKFEDIAREIRKPLMNVINS